LDDRQLTDLVTLFLKCLKSDAYLLLRVNLTNCARSLPQYIDAIENYQICLDGQRSHGVSFEFCWAKCLQWSIKHRQTWSDFCVCLKKQTKKSIVSSSETVAEEVGLMRPTMASMKFLDSQQYTDTGILTYEWIFGRGFISPGGPDQNREFLRQLRLRPGELVLDVGSGIGGNAEQMAQEFGASVTGCDLASNTVKLAVQRANETRPFGVSYVVCNILTFDGFDPFAFDLVYSRDAFLHIGQKREMFDRFRKWLKPNGRVFFTDYCVRTDVQFTAEFKAYLADRQYTLWSIDNYAQTLKEAGFEKVQAENLTDRFVDILKREKQLAEDPTRRDAFISEFGRTKYEALLSGWDNKLHFIASGQLQWASFLATA